MEKGSIRLPPTERAHFWQEIHDTLQVRLIELFEMEGDKAMVVFNTSEGFAYNMGEWTEPKVSPPLAKSRIFIERFMKIEPYFFQFEDLVREAMGYAADWEVPDGFRLMLAVQSHTWHFDRHMELFLAERRRLHKEVVILVVLMV